MRRYISWAFSLVLVLVLSVQFSAKVYAAIVMPGQAQVGSSIPIDATNIPVGDSLYCANLWEYKDVTKGSLLDTVNFTTTKGGICTITLPGQMFSNLFCQKTTSFFEFKATLDSNKLNLSTDTGLLFEVNSNTSCAQDFGTETSFVDVYEPPGSTFVINSVQPNPANLGDTVTITLSGVSPGDYEYGILGDGIAIGTCYDNTQCQLSFPIPSDASQIFDVTTDNKVTIVVQDQKKVQHETQLTINLPQTIPSGPPPASATPRPGPRPTPIPAGCSPTGVVTIECLQDKLGTLILWAYYLAGVAALIFVVYAGIKYTTSRGNPEKVQSAKDTITYVIQGVIVLAFSYVLLWLIAKITGAPLL